MSYKNNKLEEIRKTYFENKNPNTEIEKNYLKKLLINQKVFNHISENDIRYFFNTLPSEIIIKGFGLGFDHPLITALILEHIKKNKEKLVNKKEIKVQYRVED